MTKPRLKKTSLRRLVYGINRTMGIIAGIGIFVLVFLTATEVFKRYVLHMPTPWTLEISQYLLVLFTFLGMAYALQVRAHVSVDIIYRLFSERRKRIADLIVALLSLSLWAVLTGMALRQALIYLERHIRSETLLATPLFYPMMLIVIGGLAACFQSLLMAYDASVSLTSRDFRKTSGGEMEAPTHHRGEE